MENIVFWSAFVGLILNLVDRIIDIKNTRRKLFNGVKILLSVLLVAIFIVQIVSERHKIKDIKTEIKYFIKNNNEGYEYKTLSAIKNDLKMCNKDENLYLRAISEMLESHELLYEPIIVYRPEDSHPIECEVYHL
jgi:hypothetical protein